MLYYVTIKDDKQVSQQVISNDWANFRKVITEAMFDIIDGFADKYIFNAVNPDTMENEGCIAEIYRNEKDFSVVVKTYLKF